VCFVADDGPLTSPFGVAKNGAARRAGFLRICAVGLVPTNATTPPNNAEDTYVLGDRQIYLDAAPEDARSRSRHDHD
jgi:hypothetical protein